MGLGGMGTLSYGMETAGQAVRTTLMKLDLFVIYELYV